MPREDAVVRAVTRLLKQRGAWAFNVHGSALGRNGLPDIVGVFRGRALCVECKSPTGRLRPLQHLELRLAAQAGAIAIVARSASDVAARLDEIDAAQHPPSTEALPMPDTLTLAIQEAGQGRVLIVTCPPGGVQARLAGLQQGSPELLRLAGAWEAAPEDVLQRIEGYRLPGGWHTAHAALKLRNQAKLAAHAVDCAQDSAAHELLWKAAAR